jgi:transmembrane sensor
MNTQDEDILIIKILAGEASELDQNKLDAWRKSHPSHEAKFLQSQSIWDQSNRTEPDIDTDAAWLNVKGKLAAPQKTNPFGLYLKIAAAIMLISTIGWYGFLYNPTITIQTAANEQKEVLLPDGSVVWLNEKSKLSYSKKFNGTKRDVSLTGEAFFEVVKNPNLPFVITSSQSVTEVLGTSFNLKVPAGSIRATLNVVTGKVRFTSLDNPSEVIVVGGEKAEIDEVGNATKTGLANENELAWKSGKLSFNDAKLKEVFEVLEDYFKIKIAVENQDILNCHFTGTFDKPKSEQVFDIISKALQLSYTRKGKTVTIQGKGCTP